ncbi:unnamed protein product [Caenorhabditis angaria]|uniref:Uncharacterized protein n=1 Tax=Caenorhabditis angaria TaxID=860376 RepID=A0A9P1I3Q0_9PELO|nr:unnamed protein product [Caenorhabditis angaria]
MTENVAPAADETNAKIVKQIEYYFGNINLPRDKFLQEQMKLDEGWVPLTTMLKFNRLVQITTDVNVIANALKAANSELITLSEDLQKIRRSVGNPLPENSLEYWQTIKHRTVYMKGFPQDSQLDQIMSWAQQFGELENVLMRRLGKEDRIFKGSAFVTYKTREEAEVAQKSDAKFGEIELVKMMQDDYWALKNKETKESRAAAKAAKGNKSATENAEKEKARNVARFDKGLILAIDGLGEQATVDTIKTFFKQYGSVGYVAHENNSSTAEIRFNNDSEGGAQSGWDKAVAAGTDGKVIFQEKELTARVLDGEEEEKYWTEFNARKNNKQNNGRQGGRGGRRGGRGGNRGGFRGGDRRADKRSADHDDSDAPASKRTVFEDAAPAAGDN